MRSAQEGYGNGEGQAFRSGGLQVRQDGGVTEGTGKFILCSKGNWKAVLCPGKLKSSEEVGGQWVDVVEVKMGKGIKHRGSGKVLSSRALESARC